MALQVGIPQRRVRHRVGKAVPLRGGNHIVSSPQTRQPQQSLDQIVVQEIIGEITEGVVSRTEAPDFRHAVVSDAQDVKGHPLLAQKIEH